MWTAAGAIGAGIHPFPTLAPMEALKVMGDSKAVRAAFARYGRLNQRTQYPFGNPVSIERGHLPALTRERYWVTDKVDGMRACMVLTTDPATGAGLAALMDRRGTLYGLPVACDGAYFDDSIFDCEVVVSSGRTTVLVFDTCVICGDDSVGAGPLSARLKELAEVFPTGLDIAPTRTQIAAGVPGMVFVAKPMTPLGGPAWGPAVPVFRVGAPKSFPGFPTDGYILTPDGEGSPPPGTATTTLKVKTAHTLDLLWIDRDLYFGPGSNQVSVRTISQPDLPAVGFEPREFAGVPDGSVVEVEPVPVDGDPGALRLALVRNRPDRTAPNHMKCVLSTIRSALDNVSMEDVVACAKVCA